MKSMLFSLLVLVSANVALACPGGNLKILKDGETEIAEVNFSSNRVRVTDSRSELLFLGWTPANQEIMLTICGGQAGETCDFDQGLPNRLRLT
ncbi:MAG TPA: hypothetical protein VFV50_01540, partial [Bdellovibrionales bacterium]|nr:hypothetical protein [Bdellovibrionales bacterium]